MPRKSLQGRILFSDAPKATKKISTFMHQSLLLSVKTFDA